MPTTRRIAVLALCAPLLLAPSARAAEAALSGLQAVEFLLEHSDGFSIAVPAEQRDAIQSAIERDAAAQPADARLALGMALVKQMQGDNKAAREHAERAVKLSPDSADAHYWLGNTVFAGIGQAGMLDKASLASKGRKAYEKTIELNPAHAGARYALAQFYLGAPAIAGGSDRKAREEAQALLKIEDGAFLGRMTLGQLAAKEKKWDDMAREYAAAEQAAERDDRRAWALRSWAWSLIDSKKDPSAALPLIERYAAVAPPTDPTLHYFRGRAAQELSRPAEAAEHYRQALAISPNARNSGFALAECLEKAGDAAGALAAYEAFIERHKDDSRAGDAKKAVKRLKKKLG